MNMVRNAANSIAFAIGIAADSSKISMQRGLHSIIKQRQTIFRAEDHMDKNERERSRHRKDYRSGLQPSCFCSEHTRGFAPRWYSAAPLALCLVLGCHSTPAPTPASTSTTQPTTTYAPRPTTPPPPIKLFHQTDNTLTLVTTPDATNDQIAAIIWQLRDAANTHTFDTLHLPQKFIDARSPIVWFHIYRGPKCASEKYTSGKLPCGASYHAAGEFTLGSFSDSNRTDGELVVDENHSTPLWNPDAH